MFFVVETGNVSDVLLEDKEKKSSIPDLVFMRNEDQLSFYLEWFTLLKQILCTIATFL